jgi:hypothetical protein
MSTSYINKQLLIPWRKVLCEKLIVAQLVKNPMPFNVTNPGDGGSMFLASVGIHMAVQTRRPISISSPP